MKRPSERRAYSYNNHRIPYRVTLLIRMSNSSKLGFLSTRRSAHAVTVPVVELCPSDVRMCDRSMNSPLCCSFVQDNLHSLIGIVYLQISPITLTRICGWTLSATYFACRVCSVTPLVSPNCMQPKLDSSMRLLVLSYVTLFFLHAHTQKCFTVCDDK